MGQFDDDRLRADLAAGREGAVADLYDRFAHALFRVALTLLRSRADAEDAVQQVFLGVLRVRDSYSRIENLRAYLFASLRRAAARIAARPRVQPIDEPPVPHADERLDADTVIRLERGLAALPAEQREIIALKIDGGLTFAEIAKVLGIRLNTAASRYRYALEKLRAAMTEGSA